MPLFLIGSCEAPLHTCIGETLLRLAPLCTAVYHKSTNSRPHSHPGPEAQHVNCLNPGPAKPRISFRQNAFLSLLLWWVLNKCKTCISFCAMTRLLPWAGQRHQQHQDDSHRVCARLPPVCVVAALQMGAPSVDWPSLLPIPSGNW